MKIGGKYLGAFGRIETGSDGWRYLTFVIWYPVGYNLLGYRYPSLRLWGRAKRRLTGEEPPQ